MYLGAQLEAAAADHALAELLRRGAQDRDVLEAVHGHVVLRCGDLGWNTQK